MFRHAKKTHSLLHQGIPLILKLQGFTKEAAASALNIKKARVKLLRLEAKRQRLRCEPLHCFLGERLPSLVSSLCHPDCLPAPAPPLPSDFKQANSDPFLATDSSATVPIPPGQACPLPTDFVRAHIEADLPTPSASTTVTQPASFQLCCQYRLHYGLACTNTISSKENKLWNPPAMHRHFFKEEKKQKLNLQSKQRKASFRRQDLMKLNWSRPLGTVWGVKNDMLQLCVE